MHTTDMTVRFHELDPYGHVNHAVFLHYFEVARIEAIGSIGYSLDRLRQDGFHLIIVDVHVRYASPATHGDVLTVHSEVSEVRSASCRWRQRITRDGDVIAAAEIRGAFAGPDGRPCRPPTDLVTALAPLRAAG